MSQKNKVIQMSNSYWRTTNETRKRNEFILKLIFNWNKMLCQNNIVIFELVEIVLFFEGGFDIIFL